MTGVILAAGVGSRLRPLTTEKPKCLVCVNNKELLTYQLDGYRAAGIKDVIIITGYAKKAIEEYCKHISDLNITIVNSPDYESTNNMYSLYLVRDLIAGKPFILNNADLALDKEIVAKMVKDSRKDLIAVDSSQYNIESMKIRVDKGGVIVDLAKTIDESRSFGCSIDYYKVSADTSKLLFEEIVEIIESQKDLNSWTEVALQRLMKNSMVKFKPCVINEYRWVEIDNYDDLELADRLFSAFDESFDDIDAIFLDLDGTVFIGDEKIFGSDDFINKMKKRKKKVFFISNNSSKDKQQYTKKLKKFGISVKSKEIVLSTDGLINYLELNNIKDVYSLGTKSFSEALQKKGINPNSTKPEYVLVGYDTELTYKKLATACRYINEGADILATHPDVVCPTPYGPIPDAGAILEMLYKTTGVKPIKIFGKPNKSMIEHILKKDKLKPSRTVVIGDRLYTDVELANNVGAKSILLLSGDTSRDDVENIDRYPTMVAGSLGHI